MTDFNSNIQLHLFQFLDRPTLTQFKRIEQGFSGRLTPSALGRGWPLIPRVRNGECVDRRLSHSLGLRSGTASMKFLFSLLMLAWCFSRSSWVLSNSYAEQKGKRWRSRTGGPVNQENNEGRKNKQWKEIVEVGLGREWRRYVLCLGENRTKRKKC